MQETQDSPRGLILIAQVAAKLGLDELSEKALEAAVEAVPQDCHISTRLMVARYADRAGSPTTVIRLLDHHLPLDGFEREHERLAAAHANEHPHRQRNQRYFDSLPVKLRQRHGIARAHASLLLDVGRLAEASRLLRRLQADDPTDAFVTLRLIQSLRYSNEVASAEEFLRELDLQRLVGPPEYIIALAQLVLHAGCPERAYPVAYDLVRQHFDNGRVVLGYAAMGLQQDANGMFAMSVADIGAYVAIEAPDGIRQDFIIDECRDFFGIRVLPPGLGIAARVTGLRRGETFDLPKLGQDRPDTWTVTEVKSKYLHMHHRVLEEFETRFPDKPGIARFTVGDNIEAVLDVVRRSAEQNAENARL
jgi:hypothetical protein